jgi:hypothetical protein
MTIKLTYLHDALNTTKKIHKVCKGQRFRHDKNNNIVCKKTTFNTQKKST